MAIGKLYNTTPIKLSMLQVSLLPHYPMINMNWTL